MIAPADAPFCPEIHLGGDTWGCFIEKMQTKQGNGPIRTMQIALETDGL